MTKAELLASVSALPIADECEVMLSHGDDIAAIERIAPIESDGAEHPAFGLIYAAPVVTAPIIRIDADAHAERFFAWLDKTEDAAKTGPVGQAMNDDAHFWTVHHTGGGCMTWATDTDDGQAEIWICDLGNGLGDSVDEGYMIGLHPKGDWNDQFGTDCETLADALAMVPQIMAARAFALGFRADAPMTLAEFRASRREVSDLSTISADETGPGFTYGSGYCYINRLADSRVSLVIENSDWCGDMSELPAMEARLWHWYLMEQKHAA